MNVRKYDSQINNCGPDWRLGAGVTTTLGNPSRLRTRECLERQYQYSDHVQGLCLKSLYVIPESPLGSREVSYLEFSSNAILGHRTSQVEPEPTLLWREIRRNWYDPGGDHPAQRCGVYMYDTTFSIARVSRDGEIPRTPSTSIEASSLCRRRGWSIMLHVCLSSQCSAIKLSSTFTISCLLTRTCTYVPLYSTPLHSFTSFPPNYYSSQQSQNGVTQHILLD